MNTSRLHSDGTPILQFLFGIQVAAGDTAMLEALRDALEVGSIRTSPPRKDHWKSTAAYAVKSIKAHVERTIPFMERYLLPCAKRQRFEEWRIDLERYVERYGIKWERSRCSIEGCAGPVRGRGLCRSHYYRETGW